MEHQEINLFLLSMVLVCLLLKSAGYYKDMYLSKRMSPQAL